MSFLRGQDARKLRNTHYFERLLRHSGSEGEARRSITAERETAGSYRRTVGKGMGSKKQRQAVTRYSLVWGKPGIFLRHSGPILRVAFYRDDWNDSAAFQSKAPSNGATATQYP